MFYASRDVDWQRVGPYGGLARQSHQLYTSSPSAPLPPATRRAHLSFFLTWVPNLSSSGGTAAPDSRITLISSPAEGPTGG